jgi:cell division protein ZapE
MLQHKNNCNITKHSKVEEIFFIYQQKFINSGLHLDVGQKELLLEFAGFVHNVIKWHNSWLTFWYKKKTIGLYIYGGVGRGKSHIAEQLLLISNIKYIRFHYNELLTILTDKNFKLNKKYNIIFIDEFDVLDIVASVVIRDFLLEAWQAGIDIIFTSNRAPTELYKDGLQRAAFLPIINKINSMCTVFKIPDGCDYRKNNSAKSSINTAMEDTFLQHVASLPQSLHITHDAIINNRKINFGLFAGVEAAYFSIDDLCSNNMSAADYRQICKTFSQLFLSHFRSDLLDDMNFIRRFIWLIDEIYESKVCCNISLGYAIDLLLPYSQQCFEITRTASRLQELTAI